MKWSKEELEHLIYLAEQDWAWEFPGWAWVKAKLNNEFRNNRSKRACSQRFSKWVRSQQFN